MNAPTAPNRLPGLPGLPGPFLRIAKVLRLLSMLLCGMFANPLSADQSGDFTYTNNTTYVTITGYTGSGGAVVIPSTIVGLPVTTLGNYAFYYKPTITSIEIPASVTSIGQLVFSSSDGMTSITVAAGSTSFSSLDGVLFNFAQTTLVQYPAAKTGAYTIPSSVTTVGNYSFYGSRFLAGLTIPSSVTTIGDNAFSYSYGLSSIQIPATVTSIGSRAFGGCYDLTQFSVDGANPNFSSAGGVLFNKAQNTIVQYPSGKTGAYTIPGTVTTIMNSAFTNCKLTGVTIPGSVASIGDNGFYNCYQMTAVSIPASVTSIGFNAFGACFGILSFNVDAANPSYSSLDGVLFDKAQTTLIYYPSAKLGAYVIPGTVTTIEYEAFYYADITTITIPASVTFIATYGFYGCGSLTEAIFAGNAPAMGYGVFDSAAPGFTVKFYNGATGFTTPTWQGYPSQVLSGGGGGGLDFRIANLGTTNSAVVDHALLTGDDRAGIAITENVVLVTGDFYTGYYQASDFSGQTSLGLVHDGMCSDLSTRKLYLLTNNGVPHSGGSGNTINRLLEYNPEIYAYPAEINLSQSIPIPAGFVSNCGVFSGYRRVVIHNGTNVYDIQIPSGTVTDLGPMTRPNWYNSESWAVWGVAEYYDGKLQLAYRQNSSNAIVRSRVPDGVTETIATFTNLGDMASWTVDPVRNRWYFHHEGSSQFGGSSETLGYADATFTVGGGAGSDLASAVDAPSLSFTTGGSANWASQSVISHDGTDAAASGNIAESQESWMETTVAGPGSLSFWWSVSSDLNFDWLEFYVDGVLQTGRISGVVPFQQRSFVIAGGSHTLRWRYSKDGVVDGGMDTAWVDEVTWTPGGGSDPADFTYTTGGGAATVTGYTGTGGAVTIPGTLGGFPVTAIGASAFFYKPAVTSVVIPDSVVSIGSNAFGLNYNLTSVTLGSGVQSIGDYAFSSSGLTSLVLPGSLTTIGVEAFYNLAVPNVMIPASVASIGARAFKYCRATQSFSVNSGNPNYSSLGGVLFNKNQTTLIQYPLAKSGAYSVPGGVVTIGDSAFSGAYQPTGVSLPSSVLSIGDEAFYSCLGLQSITVDSGNPNFSSLGGVLFNKNQSTLVVYPGGKAGAYSVPAGVTAIAKDAFAYCWELTGVTMPSGLVSIGETAFYYCHNLTSLYFPSSVTSIGQSAFLLCSGLVSLDVAPGNPIYSSFAGVLYTDNGTTLLYCPEGRTGTFEVPFGTTQIADYAFYSCGLSGVLLPSSVTEIGEWAFAFSNQLVGVTFLGGAPVLGSYAFYDPASGFKIYYRAGASGFTSPTWQGLASIAQPADPPLGTQDFVLNPGGTITLSWPAPAGVTNPATLSDVVQRSSSVGGWTTIINPNLTISGGMVSFTDNSPLPGSGFYRVGRR
jgi:hypothetical protein